MAYSRSRKLMGHFIRQEPIAVRAYFIILNLIMHLMGMNLPFSFFMASPQERSEKSVLQFFYSKNGVNLLLQYASFEISHMY